MKVEVVVPNSPYGLRGRKATLNFDSFTQSSEAAWEKNSRVSLFNECFKKKNKCLSDGCFDGICS